MDKTLFKKTENLLRNYNTLETEIKLIESEIKDIQESYTGCGAIGYSEKVVQQINLAVWLRMKL